MCESGPRSGESRPTSLDFTLEGTGIIRNMHNFAIFMMSRCFIFPTVLFRCKANDKQDFYSRNSVSRTRTDFTQPFFWAISKSTDATFTSDVETRTRLGLLAHLRNKINQDSDFQFLTSYFNELWRKNADADIVDKTIAQPNIPENRSECKRYSLIHDGDRLAHLQRLCRLQ